MAPHPRLVQRAESVDREADALPELPREYRDLNQQIVDYYYRLGKSYQAHTPLTLK
jgi:hypothetical protein